jgi:methylated-DNA-[protein]-cysteine S-methyltransferase
MAITPPTPIYWARAVCQDWTLYLAATEEGLCYVGSANQPYGELTDWAKFRFADARLLQDDARMQNYAREMAEFMCGERTRFTIPFDLRGTPFQLAVWDALGQIPFGETRTYSDIARQIGRPDAVRAVGAAIGANPALIAVPCHRVVGKNGSLTGYRGGLPMKHKLLELEHAYEISHK